MKDKIVESLSFGTLQDCRTLKLKLDENGISWEEFLSWVEEREKRRQVITVLKRKCPGCQKWLILYEVNKDPGSVVGEDLNSQWYCSYCQWEEFSTLELWEEAKPYIEEV